MNPNKIQSILSERLHGAQSQTGAYRDLISSAAMAYEKRYKKALPETRKHLLMNSLAAFTTFLNRKNVSQQAIMSATADLSAVDNPLTMIFNLMSILIPNFAYLEACGVQPMPTKTSPVFFPQLTAGDTRNGVSAGDVLFGAAGWLQNNRYTGNQMSAALVLTDSSTDVTGAIEEDYRPLLPGECWVTLNIGGTVYKFKDDGAGNFLVDSVAAVTSGTINYTTGVVSITLDTAATVPGDSGSIDFRYDLDQKDPAQAVFEWASIPMTAHPKRLRSKYMLDNFYQAKQVLAGYNIDQAMSTSIAGYINKEISGGVFDNILAQSDAVYAFDKATPSGVSWALHRLGLIQKLVEASNAIRQNVNRAAGNVVIAGLDMMNLIETYDDTIWAPQSYGDSEPIGPYVAGRLLNRFKIIKNHDYADDTAAMVYKKDETDSSYAVGQFIGLYSTDPIAMDDLSVIQGMGTQIGEKKIFDNSIAEIKIT